MSTYGKYLSKDGVEQLRTLSRSLPTYAETIKDKTAKFESLANSYQERLGIKADEIIDAIGDVREAVTTVDAAMEELKESLSKTADRIELYLAVHYGN